MISGLGIKEYYIASETIKRAEKILNSLSELSGQGEFIINDAAAYANIEEENGNALVHEWNF